MVLGPQPRSWSTTEHRASPPPGCAFDTGSFSHPDSPTASHISQIEDAEIRGLDRGPDRRIFRIPRPGHALRTLQLFAALEFTDPAVTVTHLGWAGSRAVTRRYTRRSSQNIASATSSDKSTVVGRPARPELTISASPDRPPPSTGRHFFIRLLSVAEHREPIYTYYFRRSPAGVRSKRRAGSGSPRGSETAAILSIHTIPTPHHNNLENDNTTPAARIPLPAAQNHHCASGRCRFWTPPISHWAAHASPKPATRWFPPMGGVHDVPPPCPPLPREV
jgi:hypothetical protein